jgi:hypothetical protein
MQQRQLRLGDILDDYCPRERRVTNHVIVAMIGDDVKQVRCTTCDADHEFKHAKVPRQRRKTETPAALYAQVLATGPKRVTHESATTPDTSPLGADDATEDPQAELSAPPLQPVTASLAAEAEEQKADEGDDDEADLDGREEEEGPVHRPLIRASLPKIDGAPPPSRQIPEFTIRQPGGRPTNRFRPRHLRGGAAGGQQFQGNRSHGGGNAAGNSRGGGPRSNGGRPPQGHGGPPSRRHGSGRKRSK